MKPLIEMHTTLMVLVFGLFLSLNYSKSQDKIATLATQSQAMQDRGFLKEETEAPPLLKERLNTLEAPEGGVADEYKSPITYERVVLEGSKIIISCPHLALPTPSADHSTASPPPALWFPDKVKPEGKKQFALHYHHQASRHQTRVRHHEHRSHHSRRHQRPKLASHFHSVQPQAATPSRAGHEWVKWFRNHLPLHNDYDYPKNEPNSYNSTTYGVPSVTYHSGADSTRYVKSLHSPQTIEFSTPSQLPALQNGTITTASSAFPSSAGTIRGDNEFVSPLDGPSTRENNTDAGVMREIDDNLEGHWYISKSGELVINGATQYFSGKYTCQAGGRESSVVLEVLMERNEGVAPEKSGRDRAHKIEALVTGQPHREITFISSIYRKDLASEFSSAGNETGSASIGSRSGSDFELQTDDVLSSSSSLFDLLDLQKQSAQESTTEPIDSNISGGIAADLLPVSRIFQSAILDHSSHESNEQLPSRGDAYALDQSKNETKYVIPQSEIAMVEFKKTQNQTSSNMNQQTLGRPMSLTNLRYIKRYVHVVKNEAIKTSDLKFIPGFLYNKLQLYCPVRKQHSKLAIHFLVESLCPRHLKHSGKMNRRIECQHLARRLIKQIVSSSDQQQQQQQLTADCLASIFDLVWFKNGKRLKFDTSGKVMNADSNMKTIDPLIGLESSRGTAKGSSSSSSQDFVQQKGISDSSVECSLRKGRVLELEGPREESTGRYICSYELNLDKFKSYITRTSKWFNLSAANHTSCCGESSPSISDTAKEKLKLLEDQPMSQWTETDTMKNDETMQSVPYLDSIKNDSTTNTLDNRIFLLNSILIDEVTRKEALDLIGQLLEDHQQNSLSMIQTFSLSISERPASFSDLWSTIIRADHAYARRKRADFERLKEESTEHLVPKGGSPREQSYKTTSVHFSGRQRPSSGGLKELQERDIVETRAKRMQTLANALEEPSQPFAYDGRRRQMVQSASEGVILESGAEPSPTERFMGTGQLGGVSGDETSSQPTSDLTRERQTRLVGSIKSPLDSYMPLNNADGLLNKNIVGGRSLRARRQVKVGTFMQDAHFNYANERSAKLTLAGERSGCKVVGGGRRRAHEAGGLPPCKVKHRQRPLQLSSQPNKRSIDSGPRRTSAAGSSTAFEPTTNWAPNQGRTILIEASSSGLGPTTLAATTTTNNNNNDKTQDPIIDDKFSGAGRQGSPEPTRGPNGSRPARFQDDALATNGGLEIGSVAVTPASNYFSVERPQLVSPTSSTGFETGWRPAEDVNSSSSGSRSRKSMEYEEPPPLVEGDELARRGSVGRPGLQEDKLQHSEAIRHSASQLNSFSTQSSGSAGSLGESCCRHQRESGLAVEKFGHSVATRGGPQPESEAREAGLQRAPTAIGDRPKIDKSNHGSTDYDDTSLRGGGGEPRQKTYTLRWSQEAPINEGPLATSNQNQPPRQTYQTPAYDYLAESNGPSASGSLIDDGLMWQASQYLYMHMKAVASSSIFGVEVAVEWSNELSNGSVSSVDSPQPLATLNNNGAPQAEQRHPSEGQSLHRNYLREVPFATIDVISGQDLQLQCTAQAMGRLPEVRWYKRISTLPSQLRGLISLARKIGNDLYWPLTELDLLSRPRGSEAEPAPKSFICSKSTAIFDNLVNQTFTVVNNLQLSHYNDLLESDPIKSISLSSILTHNTYACIVDADVRHNYATLGVNFRKTPTNKLPPMQEITKRLQHSRSSTTLSQHQPADLLSGRQFALTSGRQPHISGVVVDSRDAGDESFEARFNLFRDNQLMFPIRSWTYLNNGSSASLLNKQLQPQNYYPLIFSLTPLMLLLVIAFVLTIVSLLIHLTIGTYRNLTRFSLDEFAEQANSAQPHSTMDATNIDSLKMGSLGARFQPPVKAINSSCRPTIDESGLQTGCSCSHEQMHHSSSLYSSIYGHYDLGDSLLIQERPFYSATPYTELPAFTDPQTETDEKLVNSSQLESQEAIALEQCCAISQLTASQVSSNSTQYNGYMKSLPVNLIENPLNVVKDQAPQSPAMR